MVPGNGRTVRAKDASPSGIRSVVGLGSRQQMGRQAFGSAASLIRSEARLAKRRPPEWAPATDRLAKQCGVTPVSFKKPIPPMTWCHYCDFLATTRDHVVPDAAGGADAWWNLVPSCVTCNSDKGTRQACSCMYCLRAIALWSLGFRATKLPRAEKRRRNAIAQ
jgi:hypothetical protein